MKDLSILHVLQSPSSAGHASIDELKRPRLPKTYDLSAGWLAYIRDCTTQLCRDHNTPIL